jgi:hypothetical protein
MDLSYLCVPLFISVFTVSYIKKYITTNFIVWFDWLLYIVLEASLDKSNLIGLLVYVSFGRSMTTKKNEFFRHPISAFISK